VKLGKGEIGRSKSHLITFFFLLIKCSMRRLSDVLNFRVMRRPSRREGQKNL